MSRCIVALVLSLASVSVSFAADMRVKPRSFLSPEPVATWSGFYAGVNLGATWDASDDVSVVSAPAFNAPGLNAAIVNQAAVGGTSILFNGEGNGGFIGGAQIGYNWQRDNLVFGVEADIQGVLGNNHFSGSTAVLANNGVPIVTSLHASKQVEYFGTLRARVGWLYTPTMLLYATGGLAYGGVKSSASLSQVHLVSDTFGGAAASFSDTLVGWTAGAGFEWRFLPRWSAKAEYLYYDLGDVTYNTGLLSGAFTNGFVRYAISPQVSTRFDGHIFRVGVNYHWGR